MPQQKRDGRIGGLEAQVVDLREENTSYQQSYSELQGWITGAGQKLAQAKADAQRLSKELEAAGSVTEKSRQDAQQKEQEYTAQIKAYEKSVAQLKDSYGKLDDSYQHSRADMQRKLDQAEQKLKEAGEKEIEVRLNDTSPAHISNAGSGFYIMEHLEAITPTTRNFSILGDILMGYIHADWMERIKAMNHEIESMRRCGCSALDSNDVQYLNAVTTALRASMDNGALKLVTDGCSGKMGQVYATMKNLWKLINTQDNKGAA